MPDYCTVADVKGMLADTTWSAAYDTVLQTLVTAASREIDRYTKRAPGAYLASAATTQYFDGSGTDKLWVAEMAAPPTTVAVAETGALATYTDWPASDYICWPYNWQADGQPILRLDLDIMSGSKTMWYRFPKAVRIVGKFGYSTSVPDEVKQATVITALRWFKRAQQGYQDMGGSGAFGQPMYVKVLDPEVKGLVDAIRRVVI